MKTAVLYRQNISVRNAAPYPNAMNRREAVGKVLDFLLISAISIGLTASFLFLLAL